MKKPNVLFIYPDQMRYDCMGNSGNRVIKTPGFDRLAEEGVSFTSAYTSYPLCCPFRASVMTGKYATSNGMYANHYPIELNQKFFPQIMRDNGYSTAWFGKWHLNGGKKYDHVPEEYRLGFETFVGFSRGHRYLTPVYYRNNDQTPYKSNQYEPDMQTGHLLDFLESNFSDDRPFFAGIGYGLPHTPVGAAPDYYKHLYKPDDIEPGALVPEKERENMKKFAAQYYGLIANVDYQLRRIVSWLEQKNILENTMIVLSSDHGDLCGDFGMYGKKTYYSGAMHVPFIIRYPEAFGRGIKQGHIVDPSVDIMPTILDVCGIGIPDEVEGDSLKKLLETAEDNGLRDYVFYQIPREAEGPERHPLPERGIRTNQFLYVERCGVPYAYFDLAEDPGETRNLAIGTGISRKLDKLHIRLNEIMEKYHDDWSKEIIFPPAGFQSHEDGAAYSEHQYEIAGFEV